MVQGTNFLNFMGKYIYVADGKSGFAAVPIAESTEPPAVMGSDLQHLAYPSDFEKFVAKGRELKTAYKHGNGDVLDVQLRGEYLYAAMGAGGFRVFDVANVDVKDVSQRVITAPVSPLGQRFYLKTKFTTAVASPSTLALDPLRTQIKENEEQAVAALYAFLYVTDKYEGLIVVGDPKTGVGTLLDGNPRNNFLKRAVTFNPDGKLNGARRITIAGTYAYILCDRGLEVVDLADPLHPKITAEIGSPELVAPTGIAVQFRYAFVTDSEGLKVFDLTHLDAPRRVGATLPLAGARNIYVARTYAYVSDGANGIAIVDVETPAQPKLDQIFNAGGALNTLKGRARIKRTMWSRRAQEYEAKIDSGDLVSIAEVVRDLHRAGGQPEQSYSERQLYEKALARMAREVAAVEKTDEPTAVKRVEGMLTKKAA